MELVVWRFFGLVWLLSLPFWLFSLLVPGGVTPDHLPLGDIGATFLAALAAACLLWRQDQPLRPWAMRAVDLGRTGSRWPARLAAASLGLLGPTAIVAAAWPMMRAAGLPVVDQVPLSGQAVVVFLAFLVAAAGEEMGYTAFATDPAVARFGPLGAALLIGAVHAVWHYPSMLLLGQPPLLMLWGTLYTVAFRVIAVWLYLGFGRSVALVILFHASANTARSLFPGGRAGYELGDAAHGYGLWAVVAVLAGLALLRQAGPEAR